MADVSQGPGWWIASDGKWYPPELHPSVAPPPAPPGPYGQVGTEQPTWGQPQPGTMAGPSQSIPPTYPAGYGPPPYGPPPGMARMAGAYAANPNLRVDDVLRLALAPWWKRFLAWLIDAMLLGVVFFIVFAVIGAASQNSSSTTTTQPLSAGQALAGFVGIFILVSIPYTLYFGIMNGSRRGQTLGKMALNIVVRDARTGGPIGFWRGVGRYLMTVVFYLLLFIPYLIDNLSPLWDTRRQAWHDKVVHSVVIDRSP